eukprot:2676550-Prymnesium_polylepis.2
MEPRPPLERQADKQENNVRMSTAQAPERTRAPNPTIQTLPNRKLHTPTLTCAQGVELNPSAQPLSPIPQPNP